MKRLRYFLIISLAFTALQVATVVAQTGAPAMPPMGSNTAMPPMGDMSGMPPGAPGSMPPGTMPPMGSMPPPMAPNMGNPNMQPPMGDHSGMSSLGAHCGAIQAKNEKKRMRKEVKCLRRALHEHKPTVKLRQTKDGLGAYGCGVRKTGSKPAQIACLRGMLDAPSGTPGMAPGTR